MSRILSRLSLLLVLFALACGPIVMIPGGELSGDVRAIPSDWTFTNEVDTVQLETNPEEPYSVNIWLVAAPGALYVGGTKTSTWTEHASADGRVRLRVGTDLYELKATEVSSDSDVDAFVTAAKAKYDFELEPGQRESAILFRLDAR